MEAAIAAGVGSQGPGKRPQLPSNFFKFPVAKRLKAVEQFISSFEYKRTPQTNYNAHKSRPLSRLMDTAKMIVYSPQSIKCVEAVFLALYLTAGLPDVDRIPVGFRTEAPDLKVHQHIVLAVRHGPKFGAFGISREPELMNKEFEFDSLSSLIRNFKKFYENLRHIVLDIWIGLPVEHNVDSYNFVCWRYLQLSPVSQPWKECCTEIDKLVVSSRKLWEKWLADGQPTISAANSPSPRRDAEFAATAASSSRPLICLKRPSSCIKLFTTISDTEADAAVPTQSCTKVGFCDMPVIRYYKP